MKYSWLPQIYREIAEAAGLDAARGLARVKGGMRFRAPKNAKSTPWLVDAIGETAAAAFCDAFADLTLDLPANPFEGNSQSARVRRINQAIDEGRSANQIARAENIGRRNVFYHKAKRAKRDRDPDLFS
jgi:hypothetical protein